MRSQILPVIINGIIAGCSQLKRDDLALEPIVGASPENVVFILSDDHRYDFNGIHRQDSLTGNPKPGSISRRRRLLSQCLCNNCALLSQSRINTHRTVLPHSHLAGQYRTRPWQPDFFRSIYKQPTIKRAFSASGTWAIIPIFICASCCISMG